MSEQARFHVNEATAGFEVGFGEGHCLVRFGIVKMVQHAEAHYQIRILEAIVPSTSLGVSVQSQVAGRPPKRFLSCRIGFS
jgi:hypothetical protein